MDKKDLPHASELLEHLGEIIAKINSFSSQESLLTYLQQKLKETLNTNSVWFFTVRPDNPFVLDLISVSGPAEEPSFQNISTIDVSEDAMVQLVLASDEPVTVPNAHTDPRTDKRLVEASGLNSAINCKITVENTTLGVFGTGTHFDEEFVAFNEDQVAFFKSVTNAVGICFDKFASQRRAKIDSLTQVLNRHGLEATAQTLFKLAERNFKKVGILYFDLDNFKSINDTYGHQVGDKVLQSFAQSLSSSIRESDIIARIGGDEFVVVLNNIKSIDDANNVINAVYQQAELQELLQIDAALGYSVGTAIFPDQGRTLDELLHVADTKMYKAKSASKR